MAVHDTACLVIEGDKAQVAVWQSRASALGIARVVHVASMPMDKRHRSKIDRNALRAML